MKGALRAENGFGVVHLEELYDAPIDRVWAALTDPAQLADWYGEISGDLRPGGAIGIYVKHDEWRGTGRIQACERGRHLRVTDRETIESFELGQGVAPFDATLDVTLTGQGVRAFVVAEISGMPLDKVQFYGVGWQLHAERLAHYLATGKRLDTELRWSELLPYYEELARQLS